MRAAHVAERVAKLIRAERLGFAPLLAIPLELRGTIASSRSGGWPLGRFRGAVEPTGGAAPPVGASAVIGVPGTAGVPKAPTLPSKAGATGSQRFQANPHLSATLTSYDWESSSSEGEQSAGSSLLVVLEDGFTLEHVVQEQTDKEGNVTERQTVVVKDPEGNVVEEETSCSGAACTEEEEAEEQSDDQPPPEKPSDESPQTATTTPTEGGVGCVPSDTACARFLAFVQATRPSGSLRIRQVQYVPGTMAQPPGDVGGGAVAGSLVHSDAKNAKKSALNTRILQEEGRTATPLLMESPKALPKIDDPKGSLVGPAPGAPSIPTSRSSQGSKK